MANPHSTDTSALVTDLWWFIENVSDDTSDRTDRFFALRERVRAFQGEAETCRKCGEHYSAAGDGFDGMCPEDELGIEIDGTRDLADTTLEELVEEAEGK